MSLRHSYPEQWDAKSDTYTVKQHVEDIAAFIEALGVGVVSLVGHSRGARTVRMSNRAGFVDYSRK